MSNNNTCNNTTSNKYTTPTAKMYQAGYSREQAKYKGADLVQFDELELEFDGGSIPLHLLIGVDYKEPYNCSYHRGGNFGLMLRGICKVEMV
jgi:hypothetical protein